MKVLMITDNLMKGGKERRLIELLRYFDNLGNISTDLIILKNLIEYNIVYELKKTRLTIIPRRIKKDPTVYFKLWKICRQLKPDIVHSWGGMPSIYISTICFFQQIPFINGMVVNAKCSFFTEDWVRSRLTFPFSDIILANSKAGLIAYKAKKAKGKVVYNGFNFDRTRKLESEVDIRHRYRISTPFVVCMVAAFHPRKDYHTYLQVADKICQYRDDITFIAIGDGPLKEELMNKYNSSDKILFTGNLNKVEPLLQICSVGVLLTNNDIHQEGISNSILEMMAMEIPVIASKGGGTDEIIVHDSTGFLIDPKSDIQLEKYILKLIDNSSLRKSTGINSLKRVKSVFSIEQMCNNILMLYKQLIEKKR